MGSDGSGVLTYEQFAAGFHSFVETLAGRSVAFKGAPLEERRAFVAKARGGATPPSPPWSWRGRARRVR